jgi:phosphoenolpyruvate carboxykinase (GTP)
MPALDGLDRNGLEGSVSEKDMRELLTVDTEGWLNECRMTEEYYESFGSKLPEELTRQLEALKNRLKK